MICHAPEDVLPMIIPNIKNVNSGLKYTHSYLEYLVELRMDFINGRIPKFESMPEFQYLYKIEEEERQK